MEAHSSLPPATVASFCLPISATILDRLTIDDEKMAKPSPLGLGVPQIAALLLVQSLSGARPRHARGLERALAEAIDLGNAQAKEIGVPAFIAAALSRVDVSALRRGRQRLLDFGLMLLDDDTLTRQEYLTAEGRWDYGFSARQQLQPGSGIRLQFHGTGRNSARLTSEQKRICSEIQAHTDDHIHIQGYAGTGKSFLLQSLLSVLKDTRATTLVLAQRRNQLNALMEAGLQNSESVDAVTFGGLARRLIPQDLTRPGNRWHRRRSAPMAPLSDEAVVAHLGIRAAGGLTPTDIAKAVGRTVAAFCYSGRGRIGMEHLPEVYATCDNITRQAIYKHALELWSAMLSPTIDFSPPMHDYHVIKWAAISGWKIPTTCSHVVIDESHDLVRPMLQILDASAQAVISLGDEYQALHGQALTRSDTVRQRLTVCSVRSGNVVETVVNPLIAIHPGHTKAPFQGNPLQQTEVRYYRSATVPDQPAVIVTGDMWSLFEWSQRLGAANLPTEMLHNRNDLNMFVYDCIELYRHGTRPRHGRLFRFGSWAAVVGYYGENVGFQRIDRLLRKSYSEKDWTVTINKLVSGPYKVGLIEDARNREFDTVMVTPDAVGIVRDKDGAALAATASAMYVAVTRAKRCIILPEQLRHWLEEQSAAQMQAG